jgi:ABC-2 type transport system permease protein
MTVQVLVAPLIQLLLFSHVATFEVREVNMAVVDMDRTPASGRLLAQFTASGRFHVVRGVAGDRAADRALLDRDAGMILRIPAGFERDLFRGRSTPIQVVINAEDGAAAGVVAGYARRVAAEFTQREQSSHAARASSSLEPAGPSPARRQGLEIRTRPRFNTAGSYVAFMSVGLLALLMTMVGTLLTAQNLAREKEMGTIEQLNATPVSRSQFIAGKLLPFWLLGMIEIAAGLVVIRFVLGVEFAGPVALVFLGAALFLVCALGLGLLISTSVDTQQQALFIVFFVLMVFLFMGGLFTPVSSMPGWAQVIAEGNPIKHFIALVRGVLLRGAGLSDVLTEVLALIAFGSAVLALAVARYRKTAA